MKYKTTVGDQEFAIEINCDGEVCVDGCCLPVDFRWLEGNSIFSLLMDHASFEALVEERQDGYNVLLGGRMFNVRVEDERMLRLKQDSQGFPLPSGEIAIKSPLPGLVVAVPVSVGQPVQAGDVLVILESMKMENELRAPRDGKVSSVRVQAKQNVDLNQILLVIS